MVEGSEGYSFFLKEEKTFESETPQYMYKNTYGCDKGTTI